MPEQNTAVQHDTLLSAETNIHFAVQDGYNELFFYFMTFIEIGRSQSCYKLLHDWIAIYF